MARKPSNSVFQNMGRSVWLPAFAGTTARDYREPILLHPVALLFVEAWNFSANSASSSAARSLTAQ